MCIYNFPPEGSQPENNTGGGGQGDPKFWIRGRGYIKFRGRRGRGISISGSRGRGALISGWGSAVTGCWCTDTLFLRLLATPLRNFGGRGGPFSPISGAGGVYFQQF